MVGITWLSQQSDRVINYALARFYWLDPQDFERHMSEHRRQQAELKRNRAKRGVLNFAAVKSRHAGGQYKKPNKVSPQIEELDAKLVIDQMNPILLCDSLRWLYENECRKTYHVDSKRYYVAIKVVNRLTSIDPEVSKVFYTNGYTTLRWRLEGRKGRALSDKAFKGLRDNLTVSCYYALQRSIEIEQLISDYVDDIGAIAPGLLSEAKAIAYEEFRLGKKSWIKFLKKNIADAFKSETKDEEKNDHSIELNRKESIVDDGTSEHEYYNDLARDIILREVIDQLNVDHGLVDAIYSDKNKNYKSNYSVWLQTLNDHCSHPHGKPETVNAEKNQSQLNLFSFTSYSPEVLQRHIFNKHWADESQEGDLKFHALEKEKAHLSAKYRREVILQEEHKLQGQIQLELEDEIASERDPTQQVILRKQLDEKVKVKLEKEIQAKVEKKVTNQLNSTPNKHMGRFRNHLAQGLRALIDSELEAYSLGGEQEHKTVEFWKHWCRCIDESSDRNSSKIKNLPECSSGGIAAFKYRNWRHHESLCESHHSCSYLRDELSEIDECVRSEELTILNLTLLDRLSYLSLVLTLIDSVTRVRDGSSRRKKKS